MGHWFSGDFKKENTMADLINFSGGWKKQSKNGRAYYSGLINVAEAIQKLQQIKTTQAYVSVFSVAEKKSDNSPDVSICLSAKEEQVTAPQASVTSNDIPF